MPLFTFVAHYKGGRSIRQIDGGSVQEAAWTWLDELPSVGWADLTGGDYQELLNHFEDDRAREEAITPIQGCKGVWVMHLLDTREEMLEVCAIRSQDG